MRDLTNVSSNLTLNYFSALTFNARKNSEEKRFAEDGSGDFTIDCLPDNFRVFLLGLFVLPSSYLWRLQHPDRQLHSSVHVKLNCNFSRATVEKESLDNVCR